MANQLDLEEQEQLDQIKHFWKQYGNQITWVLIVVLGAFAAWNFYQYWQRSQASQAAAMFDEVERALASAEMPRIERSFNDMKERFASTPNAHQAGLLVAKQYYAMGQIEPAKQALAWVSEKAPDTGYQAIARLRMAAILADGKAYDEALKQLSWDFPSSFEALVADRKGDILSLQGKKPEALAQYQKAYTALEERADYRRLIEVKLNALGVDPQAAQRPSGSTGSTSTSNAEGSK